MSGAVKRRKYEYRPLRAGPNNIRLIQILPGVGDDTIVCQVFQYTLRNEQTSGLYEALSYFWGDSNHNHEIHLKNAEDLDYSCFIVTDNLHGAMRRLRDPDLPRTIWIDAICINQDDLQERAAQVQIMAKIYAYALSVTVWLGEERNDSSSVMKMCRDLVALGRSYSSEWRLIPTKVIEAVEDALTLFLDRPWFRRVWVVQEVAVAKVVSVLCGRDELTGAIFANGLQAALRSVNYLYEEQEIIPPVLKFMDKSNASYQVLRKLADLDLDAALPSFEVLPLGELLEMFRYYEATDRRDKVYALLGLSSDNRMSPNLQPDYTKTLSDLFGDTIKHILGAAVQFTICEGSETAVIISPGCVLGTIVTNLSGHAHELCLQSPLTCAARSPAFFMRATWAVPGHVDSVKDGDLLCILQGSRQPSIIRLCGDHYDVIVISLSPPELVWVEAYPWCEGRPVKARAWKDIVANLRTASRELVLVWNWSSRREHESESHAEMFENSQNCRATGPTAIDRVFRTARILDDLGDHPALLSLLEFQSWSDTRNVMVKHLILLHYACLHWTEYMMLKHHIVELHWCYWILTRARPPEDIEEALWHADHCYNFDLKEIIDMFEASAHPLQQMTGGYKPGRWTFDEGRLVELLRILSPWYVKHTKLKIYPQQSIRSSPHNGRYVMRAFLATRKRIQSPQESLLWSLRGDSRLWSRFELMLAMVSEHNEAGFDWLPAFWYAQSPPGNFGLDERVAIDDRIREFILVEVADNPVSLFHYFQALCHLLDLEELDFDPFEYACGALKRALVLLTYHIEKPGLCELEMGLWRKGHGRFTSVLRMLCTTAPDIMYGTGGYPTTEDQAQEPITAHLDKSEERGRSEEHSEGDEIDYKRQTRVSTIRLEYPLDFLARFARRCVLYAFNVRYERMRSVQVSLSVRERVSKERHRRSARWIGREPDTLS